MGPVDGHIRKGPAGAGQTREARFASVNAGGGEMGAGSTGAGIRVFIACGPRR